MASSYPGALDNLKTDYLGTDQADVVDHAGMHNTEGDAINAVQAELGTNPSGTAVTVAQRLAEIESGERIPTLAVEKVAGAVQSPAANVTLTSADSLVLIDTTAGARTVTLPAASTMTGRSLRIVKTGGANLLTVQRAGSDLLAPGGKTSLTFPSDCAMGEIEVASSGTGWRVVSGQATDESVGSRLYKWSQALAATGTGASLGWSLVGQEITNGLGSPQGIVSASPGAEFVQTDSLVGVGGLVVWRKVSGTGASGWEVDRLDTGWLDIASLLSANWAPSSVVGYARARWKDGMIYLALRVSPTAANTGNRNSSVTFFADPLPVGWHSRNPYNAHGVTLFYPGTYPGVVTDLVLAGLYQTIFMTAPATPVATTDTVLVDVAFPAAAVPTALIGTRI